MPRQKKGFGTPDSSKKPRNSQARNPQPVIYPKETPTEELPEMLQGVAKNYGRKHLPDMHICWEDLKPPGDYDLPQYKRTFTEEEKIFLRQYWIDNGRPQYATKEYSPHLF